MERTTVYLDPELKRRLKEAAARTGSSEASLIREALSRYLVASEPAALRPVGRSKDGGVADRDEDALGDLGFGAR
jgi:predicted transcriptional regulator